MHLDAKYWLWFRQEDPSLSPQRIQEICCEQRQGAGTSDDAQQVTSFSVGCDSHFSFIGIFLVLIDMMKFQDLLC